METTLTNKKRLYLAFEDVRQAKSSGDELAYENSLLRYSEALPVHFSHEPYYWLARLRYRQRRLREGHACLLGYLQHNVSHAFAEKTAKRASTLLARYNEQDAAADWLRVAKAEKLSQRRWRRAGEPKRSPIRPYPIEFFEHEPVFY